MVQNVAEGNEDVRSVNPEQGCSHTEIRIVDKSNKLAGSKLHCIFRVLLRTNSRSYIRHVGVLGVSRNFLEVLNNIIARFLNWNILERFRSRLNDFKFEVLVRSF